MSSNPTEKRDMSPICMQVTSHDMNPREYLHTLLTCKIITLEIFTEWHDCNCGQCTYYDEDKGCLQGIKEDQSNDM